MSLHSSPSGSFAGAKKNRYSEFIYFYELGIGESTFTASLFHMNHTSLFHMNHFYLALLPAVLGVMPKHTFSIFGHHSHSTLRKALSNILNSITSLVVNLLGHTHNAFAASRNDQNKKAPGRSTLIKQGVLHLNFELLQQTGTGKQTGLTPYFWWRFFHPPSIFCQYKSTFILASAQTLA